MADAHQGTYQVLLGCSDGYVRVYWLNSYGEILLEPANRSTDRAGPLYKYKWWHPLADIEDKTTPDSASGSKLNQQLQKRTDRKRRKEHRGTPGERVSPEVTAMELTKTDLYVAYKSGAFEEPRPPHPLPLTLCHSKERKKGGRLHGSQKKHSGDGIGGSGGAEAHFRISCLRVNIINPMQAMSSSSPARFPS